MMWQPTRESYLQYLVDTKVVFDAIEKVPADPSFRALCWRGWMEDQEHMVATRHCASVYVAN